MTIYSLDVLLSDLEPVPCSMSSSNCCFLTFVQVSQEPGKVVWCYHLLKNFALYCCCDSHYQDFSILNDAEVDFFFFWNSLAFSMIQLILTLWFLVPLPFLNPAYTSESLQFTYCWSLVWRILSITLWNANLACEMSTIVQQFEYFLALLFSGIGMKTDIFHSCGHKNGNLLTNLLTNWVQHFNRIIF